MDHASALLNDWSAAAPYHDFPSRVRPGDGYIVREIAIRWLAKPQGVTARYEIVGGGTAAADKPRDADGNYIDNLYTTARAFPADAKTADVRFIVADGAWETVVATDGRSDFAIGQGRYSFAFTQASMRTQGLALSIAHNILDQDVRIVAIDQQGNEIAAPYGARAGGGVLRLTTGVFPQLKIEDVREFELQTRPVHRVEVRNISLVSDEVTAPEAVVIDEAPVN